MPSPLRYPITCAPELLAEAERLAELFTGLAYQHCITLAVKTVPGSVLSEAASRRAESRRAHRRTATRGLHTGWDR